MRVTVGGFVGGDIKDPYFKELLVRCRMGMFLSLYP